MTQKPYVSPDTLKKATEVLVLFDSVLTALTDNKALQDVKEQFKQDAIDAAAARDEAKEMARTVGLQAEETAKTIKDLVKHEAKIQEREDVLGNAEAEFKKATDELKAAKNSHEQYVSSFQKEVKDQIADLTKREREADLKEVANTSKAAVLAEKEKELDDKIAAFNQFGQTIVTKE